MRCAEEDVTQRRLVWSCVGERLFVYRVGCFVGCVHEYVCRWGLTSRQQGAHLPESRRRRHASGDANLLGPAQATTASGAGGRPAWSAAVLETGVGGGATVGAAPPTSTCRRAPCARDAGRLLTATAVTHGPTKRTDQARERHHTRTPDHAAQGTDEDGTIDMVLVRIHGAYVCMWRCVDRLAPAGERDTCSGGSSQGERASASARWEWPRAARGSAGRRNLIDLDRRVNLGDEEEAREVAWR